MTGLPAEPFVFSPPLWLDETGSTSEVLKEQLARGDAPRTGTVVAALRQTRGRGRMGGEWHSSPRGDLTFSFFYLSAAQPFLLGTLPMACCLGVRDFLSMAPRSIPTVCKWPNDVMADDAKICGILSESCAVRSGGTGVVIGIGVNLRRVPGRDAMLGRRTAAVEEYAAEPGDPVDLLPGLLGCLATRIAMWQAGGFAAIAPELRACQWGVGREVAAKTPAGVVRGRVAGLGEQGELLLAGAEGTVVRVSSVTALDGWDAT